ncbi:hypothetical protein ABEV55_14750 [Aneurinibacillus thermoaerophilus]|uniref:hypothetical protein n=1 Tax=Aneurinibacillus thermoaerophilus TaxID=143495 RepID=UPI002E2281A4|nr:hypothetical protein [Aneurinibacillus thermoaerophilus]
MKEALKELIERAKVQDHQHIHVGETIMTVRRNESAVYTLDQLHESGALTVDELETLRQHAQDYSYILIVGPVGSGKTVLSRAIVHENPQYIEEFEVTPKLMPSVLRSICSVMPAPALFTTHWSYSDDPEMLEARKPYEEFIEAFKETETARRKLLIYTTRTIKDRRIFNVHEI